MTDKRFTVGKKNNKWYIKDNWEDMRYNDMTLPNDISKVCMVLNDLSEENEKLKNRINDWHQRTFKAHGYFNLLEKVIDEVCDDDINNQIWKEYEKREKLIE